MSSHSFSKRAYSFFKAYPAASKLLLLSSFSGGGLLVFSDSAPPKRTLTADGQETKKKKVVVLGSGWGGYSFLSHLNNPNYDVQVVSPRNFFLFTPLLPSVTNGTVEARSIVEPIRGLMRKKGFEYTEAECVNIDPSSKKIHCRSSSLNKEFDMDYDILVVAVGAKSNTFNTPGVEEHAHFLKEAEDALKIRRSVINCFERASLPSLTEEERKKILHFVVVGGGPTGVEFSAELHDFLVEDVAKIYPKVQEFTRITLLEAGEHILNTFDKRITAFAEEKFQRDGIDLKTENMVVGVTADEISTKEVKTGEIVSEPYGMVVWSTGVGIRPVIKDFMNRIGQGQRRVLATDEWLRVEGCDSVYALGDTATINQRKVMEDIAAIFSKADKGETGTLNKKEFKSVVKDICQRYPQVELYLKKKKLRNIANLLKSANGDDTEVNIETFKKALSEVDTQMKNLPPTAQVASQQGKYLATCFNKMEKCEKKPEGPLRFRGEGRHMFQPFRYRHFGSFAPLGGEQAAAELPGDWVSIGHSSQWLWYSVYASKLVSWRTRSLVVSDWVRRFIFGRDSSSI
ncbi:FAD/NAD(P)-binding domain-containing protein [Hirschfeldia incana]|nr:FAD/NAD(P)-binding domain-containing protein [Hirschfeldia incana]